MNSDFLRFFRHHLLVKSGIFHQAHFHFLIFLPMIYLSGFFLCRLGPNLDILIFHRCRPRTRLMGHDLFFLPMTLLPDLCLGLLNPDILISRCRTIGQCRTRIRIRLRIHWWTHSLVRSLIPFLSHITPSTCALTVKSANTQRLNRKCVQTVPTVAMLP